MPNSGTWLHEVGHSQGLAGSPDSHAMSRRKQTKPQHLRCEEPQPARRELAEAARELAGGPGEWRCGRPARGPDAASRVFLDSRECEVPAPGVQGRVKLPTWVLALGPRRL